MWIYKTDYGSALPSCISNPFVPKEILSMSPQTESVRMHRIRALGLGQHWMIRRRTCTKALQVPQVTIRTNRLHPCVYASICILINSCVGTFQ